MLQRLEMFKVYIKNAIGLNNWSKGEIRSD